MSARAALALAGALSALPAGALAQTPSPAFEQAREQFELAVAAVRQGRPADAVGLFERSYAVRPAPVVAVNLAFCLRGLARYAEARGWYLRFRESASPEDLARHGATVEAHLEEISRRVARVTFGERDPATVTLRWNDRPLGPEGLWVDPGTYRVTATAEGFRAGASAVTARAGDELRLSARLTAEETPTPLTRRWWFWTALGVAVVGVTTAVLVPLLATEPSPSGIHEVRLP